MFFPYISRVSAFAISIVPIICGTVLHLSPSSYLDRHLEENKCSIKTMWRCALPTLRRRKQQTSGAKLKQHINCYILPRNGKDITRRDSRSLLQVDNVAKTSQPKWPTNTRRILTFGYNHPASKIVNFTSIANHQLGPLIHYTALNANIITSFLISRVVCM